MLGYQSLKELHVINLLILLIARDKPILNKAGFSLPSELF